jgi:hypothetical protein
MADHIKTNRGVIHPSIEGLVALIKSADPVRSEQETTQLRDACRSKLRSYSLEAYLRRYTTEPEQAAARDRWEIVAAFANRGRIE